jgi:ATP-dependent exoDNAse (exonuclease V) beta subunit
MTNKLTFISAGAGSGKTYTLTEILRKELVAGAVRPEAVIATTFTRKAASELRERVREHLLKSGETSLANALGQARIGTVNGVCGGLLQRFAFEAGMSPEQQVLEEDQVLLLLKESIDDVIDNSERSNVVALAMRLEIESWESDLGMVVNQARSNMISVDQLNLFAEQNANDLLGYFPSPAKDDLEARLMLAIEKCMPELERAAESSARKNTKEYLSQVKEFKRAYDRGSLTWSSWVRLSKASPEAGLKNLVDEIASISGRYAELPKLHEDIRSYLHILFSLAAKTLAGYARRKVELGVLDFVDQESLLLELLDHPEVSSVLKDELDLLMVDEFQDTSPIQLALFLKLTKLAKQTYWVGDIKQAIYSFRGSDTALMNSVIEALPTLGGKKEILGNSWRSRPPLVELVNKVYSKAFAPELSTQEVELNPRRKEVLTMPAFSNWILEGTNVSVIGESLAVGIRELMNRNFKIVDKHSNTQRCIQYSDIAILSKTNDGVSGIAETLKRFGIPAATAQAGLLKTPEAVLALACLRRLNDVTDTIATAEILSLADSLPAETWLVDRLQYLESGEKGYLWKETGDDAHPVLLALANMRDQLVMLSPYEAFQAVLTQCELYSRVLAWTPNIDVARSRLANLEALLGMAADYEDACRNTGRAATISGFIIWIGEKADKTDTLAQPAVDAIRVMTLHAAKGLEWPVVILTDLEKNIKDRLWSITTVSHGGMDVGAPLKDRFIRFWPWPFGSQQKVSISDKIDESAIAGKFKADAAAEAKRLLYVSMTRARDLLILARPAKKQTGPWLEVVDAPWLLPEVPTDRLPLPEKDVVPYWQQTFSAAGAEAPENPVPQSIHWYKNDRLKQQRLPLYIQPSAADSLQCMVTEQVKVGQRIIINPKTDMAELGTALHACIALSFIDPVKGVDVATVTNVFEKLAPGTAINPDEVLYQIDALNKVIKQRWPNCKAMAEVPVTSVRLNGQVLRGQIDLLLDVGDGWVLIDHKSSPQGEGAWNEIAQTYAGQLVAYKQAIEAASNKPVKQMGIFLPVSAGMVMLDA